MAHTSHTKRTPAFQLRLKRLSEKLLSNTLDSAERMELDGVLRFKTTDSPCIVKASDDEPIFVLRGQDELAAGVVANWASRYAEHHQTGDVTLPADKELTYDDALECAREMALFPGRRVPN